MGDIVKFSETNISIKAKTEKVAEIIIYDIIGSSYWDETVSAKSFCDELSKLPESIETINVRINSPGGDVFDGQTIYNRLKQHKAKIVVYVDAMAASIASIIAMAGDEIIMSEGSQMMIHKPMTGRHGNSIELQEAIDLLDSVEEQMLGIYSRRTGTDKEEIRQMLAAETWLTAEQAVDMGFATKAMEKDEEFKAVACDLSRVTWFKRPEAVTVPTQTDIVKDDIKKTLGELTEFLDK